MNKHSRKDYETCTVLGYGNQGTVKLARHKASGNLVAIKAIAKPQRDNCGSRSPTLSSASSSGGGIGARVAASFEAVSENLKTEIAAMVAMAGHPGVPRFNELMETSSKWYIVQEYVPGPTLETYIQQCGGRLPETVASDILSGILYTLARLHFLGIVHRDLKPANILLRDPMNPSDVVLIDFGSSFTPGKKPPVAGAECSSVGAMKTICGTPYFLSPELTRGEDYSAKVDIWAVGCLAYTMLFGKSPFADSGSYSTLYSRISRADYSFPADVNGPSETARWFVRSLLEAVPAFRPEAGQALSHPWISPPTPSREIGTDFAGADRFGSGMLVTFDEATGSLMVNA